MLGIAADLNPRPFLDVRFGSKADMCNAIGHVYFTPNSDIDCVFRHGRLGLQADSTSSIRSLLGAHASKAWLPNITTAQSASPSDHLSLDYGQSEQQDYPERTGISL
jgi:hypothetical protein